MEADTGRQADSRTGELSVAIRDRGVEATVEADKQTTGLESYMWSCNSARGLSVVMQELHFLQCRNSPDKTRDITRKLWRSLVMSSQARGM